MARPLRLVYPGAFYHVFARGNDRQTVFRDGDDCELFFAVIDHTVDRYGWLCHTYCLMGNHYHLLIETPQANLSLGMRQLNGLYARRFNLRHGRCGHVFQARFRSILVEAESSLLSVSRYIVLNPVRAGICTDPADWPWSSYRALAGLEPPRPFLSTELLLSHFGSSLRAAQAGYRRFVAKGLEDALEERVRGERLGSDAFLRSRFGLDPPMAEIPRAHIEPVPPPLTEIFRSHPAPVAAAYREHGYTLREIAAHLGCHYSTVSRKLQREEEKLLQRKT
jgi:REP-associated tyrosine transposase